MLIISMFYKDIELFRNKDTQILALLKIADRMLLYFLKRLLNSLNMLIMHVLIGQFRKRLG